MMSSNKKVIAYIDGANLHKAVSDAGWRLNDAHFRSWLRQKFSVTAALLFIGLIPKHSDLYTRLQAAGYQLVFKEVVYDGSGKAKGNCDADLVLQAARDYFEQSPTGVVLVSSDGDYAPLVKFWQEKNTPCTIISPAPVKKCSILLKRTAAPIVYLGGIKHKLEYR